MLDDMLPLRSFVLDQDGEGLEGEGVLVARQLLHLLPQSCLSIIGLSYHQAQADSVKMRVQDFHLVLKIVYL